MIGALRVAALLRATPSTAEEPLRVYWHQVTEGSRDTFASELHTAAEGAAVVPLVLRTDLFNNPNALLSDLRSLLERNRKQFLLVAAPRGRCLDVVLLTRSPLRIPQVSSPIVLPDWFPVLPGQEIDVRLVVLADSIEDTLLNADEARVEQMSELLGRLEQLLVERLEEVHRARPARLDRLFGGLRVADRELSQQAREVVQTFRRYVQAIPNVRGYRPSVRESRSLVSLLIRLVLRSSPDELAKWGEGLAEALDLGKEDRIRPPILSVMCRPSRRLQPQAMTGHSILTTIYWAYQFITGAAHAGEYPSFPVGLIHSTSVDLRRALQDSAEMVRTLPHPAD